MAANPLSKNDFAENLQKRTKLLALRSIKLFQHLPHTEEARIIGRQLLRSATSVGANYRAVCRARSKAEHFAKLCICVEEADETLYWLELLTEADIVPAERTIQLYSDFEEVVKILAKARKTASA